LLSDAGYTVVDMTDSELAKLHVRYMIGGRADEIADEHLFRFEFPERPGALLRFLEAVGTRWNISLFHYRNHGAAYGRVLAGFEIGADSDDEFAQDLERLGFWFREETLNPALRQFVGAHAAPH
jgi:threonine dehydratase